LNQRQAGGKRRASRPNHHFFNSPRCYASGNGHLSGWNCRDAGRKCGISMVAAIIPIGIGSLPTGMAFIPAGTGLFPAGTGLAGSEAHGLELELEFGDPEK
jgi:hypothetical protein